MSWEPEVRNERDWYSNTTIIDEDLIQSGDALVVTRMDGLDQMISWGVGSHIGHAAIAMRDKGELYVVEIQNTWYWPTHGA